MELNVELIKEAAEVLNNDLTAKGFIEKKLLFPTINWDDLKKEQPDSAPSSLAVTETLYDNDKNVINILYGLLYHHERDGVHRSAYNQAISNKDLEIKKLKDQVSSLSSKVLVLQLKNNALLIEKKAAQKENSDLRSLNKAQLRDLNKLKAWSNDLNQKYEIESKRNSQIISNLKDQLIEKKNLSTTITYGARSKTTSDRLTRGSPDEEVSSNYIFNNNPIIDNLRSVELPVKALEQQYEEIVSNLTDLAHTLVDENYKFLKFLDELNNYYTSINDRLNGDSLSELPPPSDAITLDYSGLDADLNSFDIKNFEVSIQPIMENIWRNYNNVTDIIDSISSFQADNNKDEDKDTEIERLRNELNTVTQSWQQSLKDFEKWRGTRID